MSHQLKIELKFSEPKIYRTVIVPEGFNFEQLHRVVQNCFNWEDYHLYQFNIGAPYNSVSIKPEDPNDDLFDFFGKRFENFPPEETYLADYFNGQFKKINYTYDFGDDWLHEIRVLKKPEIEVLYPKCIKAENIAPVEDCSGIGGFYEMLEILNQKKNTKEKLELREWLELDPGEEYEELYGFDIEQINNALILEFSN
jgi:hypothetical protein